MRALRILTDLAFPRRCASCEAITDEFVCSPCTASIPWIVQRCQRCAMPAARLVRRCSWCARATFAFAGARAAARYAGPARDALMTFKLGGERRGAAWLAAQTARVAPHADVCAVVPSTRRSRAQRGGFDPAGVLAGAVARALGFPLLPLLGKVGETADQAGLSAEQRRTNLASAFAPRGHAGGRRVLLVDDVMTTGATADACARALLAGGASRVEVLTFARAG
jgi:predicted amidophosphoribosyltransferase